MSVKIRCPACRAVHSVHHRMQGKTIKCPSCGGEILVPTAEQFEAAARAIEDTTSARPASTTAAPKTQNSSAAPEPTRAVRASSPATVASNQASSAESLEKELAASVTSFQRPKQAQTDEMDMTPMVDVTFLLLIFFMITASFAVQKSIQRPTQKTDAPSSTAQQIEEDKDSLVIQVDEFNAYNIIISGSDTSASSKQDLIVKLKDYQGATNAGERAVKLVVDAHENCIHSAVVDALDAGREAGFENFEVRTVEQFD
jgi:biopolymer transport protein ExbD/ribosomal protein S27E